MKRLIAIILLMSVFLSGCSSSTVLESESVNSSESSSAVTDSAVNLRDISYLNAEAEDMNFTSMSDPNLLDYMEGSVYCQLVDQLGDDAYVENVSAVYISQEYIDELTYNSKANLFFGYTLQELNEQFQGQRYVFTVENGKTVVQPMAEYDDTYYQIVRNVAIGTGVILVCVTISVVTYGAGAPAASMIFATAAESGAIMGLSSGVISGAAAGISTGVQTGDWDQALKDGALAGSEGFKMGAICGAIAGGAGEAIGLHGATLNGLTMDEAATIQRESKIPLKLIKEFKSMEQYEIIKDSGMYGGVVDGAPALIRDIDLKFADEKGVTNLERMKKGLAALDPKTGIEYELHHMGQTQDATMAILTQAEHRGVGNHAVWHDLVSKSQVDHGTVWTKQRQQFWKSLASIYEKL